MTLAEWERYIRGLTGPEVRSKAIAANTQKFVDLLKGEGKSMHDVKAIFTFFVHRLLLTGQKIPEGGALDLHFMARRFEALNGPVEPLSEEEASTPSPGHYEPPDGLQAALDAMVEG